MARSAAKQDRAQKLCLEYVYQQRTLILIRRTNGKLAREETAEYLVTPTLDGTRKELKRIGGRLYHKGKGTDFNPNSQVG